MEQAVEVIEQVLHPERPAEIFAGNRRKAEGGDAVLGQLGEEQLYPEFRGQQNCTEIADYNLNQRMIS